MGRPLAKGIYKDHRTLVRSIWEKYDINMATKAIAKRVGVSYATVNKILNSPRPEFVSKHKAHEESQQSRIKKGVLKQHRDATKNIPRAKITKPTKAAKALEKQAELYKQAGKTDDWIRSFRLGWAKFDDKNRSTK